MQCSPRAVELQLECMHMQTAEEGWRVGGLTSSLAASALAAAAPCSAASLSVDSFDSFASSFSCSLDVLLIASAPRRIFSLRFSRSRSSSAEADLSSLIERSASASYKQLVRLTYVPPGTKFRTTHPCLSGVRYDGAFMWTMNARDSLLMVQYHPMAHTVTVE